MVRVGSGIEAKSATIFILESVMLVENFISVMNEIVVFLVFIGWEDFSEFS